MAELLVNKKPILVTGDLMLDHYIIGRVSRISPEAPVPIVNVKEQKYTLGGSANVSSNLAGMQVPNMLFGAIGNDTAATELQNLCGQRSIDLRAFYTDAPTIQKTRIIGEHQQIVRVDFEEPFTAHDLATSNFLALVSGKEFSAIVISDYGKGLCGEDFCQQLLSYAQSKGLPVIVDPKGTQWQKYHGADFITPNLLEFSQVVGSPLPNEDAAVERHGQEIRGRFGFKNLLVTRSEKGMTWVSEHGIEHFPTDAVEVYDVSGAGDTVVATVASLVAAGVPIPTVLKTANYAGGIVVSKFGTYAISPEEFAQAYARAQA